MKRKTQGRNSFWIYLAISLLFLTLLSTALLPGLAARFSANTQGHDASRVAIFDISESGEATTSFTVEMAPGDPESVKALRITSASEVTVRYTLTVTTTGNLPLRYSWDGSTPADNNVTATVTIEPGSYQKDHMLTISWLEGANSYLYENEVEHITVTVKAEQVD